MTEETPTVFKCRESRLIGIFHKPEKMHRIGVLILVGGGQYRVGSHRQFVLLSRYLAEREISVMRFDYRGMGDSEGEQITFENCELDLKSAIDNFFMACPELEGVVVWGLCDAASAAVFYAYQDPRVKGLILLNPWINSKVVEAQAYIKHYYFSRFLNGDMWRKILAGNFNFQNSFGDFFKKLKLMLLQKKTESMSFKSNSLFDENIPIANRMHKGLTQFNGETLIILSGNDLTSSQFRELSTSNFGWRRLMPSPKISTQILEEADHTFSSNLWRSKVEVLTFEWLESRFFK